MLRIIQITAIFTASFFLTLAVPAIAATGEWWEVTVKMEMPGMPAGMVGMMPAQTSKICMIKGQEKEPVKSKETDKDCTISDLKQSSTAATFNMKCTGKNPMTGNAELAYTPNSFNQKMKMQSKDGNMTMVSNGKRIGGACEQQK